MADTAKAPTAVIETDLGTINVEFWPDVAPKTVQNFVDLSKKGFYNGLIGPGTGTLMVFGFVAGLGVNFLKSSGMAKVANVAADLSSWIVLYLGGFVVWSVAVPLIIGNVLGSYLGSRLAILKGSVFVRWVFLSVVLALIARYAWLALEMT